MILLNDAGSWTDRKPDSAESVSSPTTRYAHSSASEATTDDVSARCVSGLCSGSSALERA